MIECFGTLILDYKSFKVSDGIEYWKVLAPQLIFRLLYKKTKRDRVCGVWWLIGDWVVWFKKMKYYEETKLSKERLDYSRKEIQK